MSQEKIDIIKRQTDYDEEQIKEKLEKFNGDMEKVLKDFHGISDKKEETNILVPAYEHYDFDNESGFVKTNANDFSSILSIGRERKVNASRFKLRKREQFDYFEEYELDTLKKIYANRYFVDNKKGIWL